MKPANNIPFKTYGLTHIALAVKDVRKSMEFYQRVFGMGIMYKGEGWVQLQTPGTNDILVLEENKNLAGKTTGGILHFGFRLTKAEDIAKAIDAVRSAGGTIKETGEFVKGEPYVFFYDPDGYEIEVWYEIPNPGTSQDL